MPRDHSGGNTKLAKILPDLKFYAGSREVSAATNIIGHLDKFNMGGMQIECFATPCHTKESICFLVKSDKSDQGAIFTGNFYF